MRNAQLWRCQESHQGQGSYAMQVRYMSCSCTLAESEIVRRGCEAISVRTRRISVVQSPIPLSIVDTCTTRPSQDHNSFTESCRASCLMLLQTARAELNCLAMSLPLAAVLNSLLLHASVAKSRFLHSLMVSMHSLHTTQHA